MANPELLIALRKQLAKTLPSAEQSAAHAAHATTCPICAKHEALAQKLQALLDKYRQQLTQLEDTASGGVQETAHD